MYVKTEMMPPDWQIPPQSTSQKYQTSGYKICIQKYNLQANETHSYHLLQRYKLQLEIGHEIRSQRSTAQT